VVVREPEIVDTQKITRNLQCEGSGDAHQVECAAACPRLKQRFELPSRRRADPRQVLRAQGFSQQST
jgi:hypothetical protein